MKQNIWQIMSIFTIFTTLGCNNLSDSSDDYISPSPDQTDSTETSAPAAWNPTAGYLHKSLDPADPVYFYGDSIEYRGERIPLGPKTIYIDGSLPDILVANHPYGYNDFVKAAAAFQDGTETEPMQVLLAPWVYSIDDPGVTAISGQYGMIIEKAWLYWRGLTYKAANVIICSYRGENWGAGPVNYTNFQIRGDGFSLQDLTIGNYCTVDLNYPLKPEFSRPKVTASNTHAQLISYTGDKAVARRTRFVSRLNMFPIMGATRVLYDKCHFECTDDALTPKGVYVNCDFDFYGKFPFYDIEGAVLLNCLFRCHIGDEPNVKQYFSKNAGASTIVDGRFFTDLPGLKVGWTRDAPGDLRGYQYNISLNGSPALISDDVPGITVDLKEYPELLKAYKFTHNEETIYNTYNLLRGDDDWDPMNIKNQALAASAGNIPTRMIASVTPDIIETGSGSNKSTTNYTITVTPASNLGVQGNAGAITWGIYEGKDAATIEQSPGIPSNAVITAANLGVADVPVVVEGVSALGLHAATILTSKPGQRSAPAFSTSPSISLDAGAGKLKVNYTLNLAPPLPAGLTDQSVITWYRCSTASGADPVLVAVSRLDIPEYEYTLTPGDVNYFIRAEVEPKHNISLTGSPASATYNSRIAAQDVKNPKRYTTDFRNFPDTVQNTIMPGLWTRDGYRYPDGSQPQGSLVADSSDMPNFTVNAGDSRWNYGIGIGGGAVYGLRSGHSAGSRLMYTPPSGSYGDMSLTLAGAPEKLEGQGFASAGNGMDVLIKFDTAAKTGYGVRLQRIRAFGDAVVVNLIRYENGTVTYLTDTGSADKGANSTGVSAYQADSTIELKVTGSTLSVKVTSTAPQQQRHINAGYIHEVNLSRPITPNEFGGIHIYHFGGQGTDGRTVLRSLDVQWQ